MYACLSPTGGYNHFLLGTDDLFYYFQESCVTFKNLRSISLLLPRLPKVAIPFE